MIEKELDKATEIKQLKQNNNSTKRVISEELEAILYEPLNLLDHGFVRVIDYMGNDNAITQAARVSYGKGTKSLQNDKMLIRYLMKHFHTSPFEMCEIKFHVKAPIFVARQWVRHRTANINEYSGRYSLMSDEHYIPKPEHITNQSVDNKQGRGSVLEEPCNTAALNTIKEASTSAYKSYEQLLNSDKQDEEGIAREIARIILPLNSYTEFYWKIDLHNLLHFLNLRAHPHAQYEIRVYAELMLEIVKKWVPIVYEAFIDYKKDAVSLSKDAYTLIKDLLSNNTKLKKNNYKLSKREWQEVSNMFGADNINSKLIED